MTENISHAQWLIIKEHMQAILIESDTLKELRMNLKNWMEEYVNSHVDLEY